MIVHTARQPADRPSRFGGATGSVGERSPENPERLRAAVAAEIVELFGESPVNLWMNSRGVN
jgi:hypothetical protein